MHKTVLREAEAIYEAGVLRPLKPIDLAENTRVHVSVSEADDPSFAFSLEWLPDEQLISLANMRMSEIQQGELSDLLADQRENQLTAEGTRRLEDLLSIYRRGIVLKARAAKAAVQRGLLAPLGLV
jgi:predicted DNA-binding antitoxin AbrB/MazE fold protein